MKKTVKIAIGAVVAIVVIDVAILGYNAIMKDINGSDNGDKQEYTLVIKNEDFQYQVAASLKQGGIVIDDSIWSVWPSRSTAPA